MNEEFVGHKKLDIDQLWVVESTEHIFKGDRDVLELLRGRKTGFSLKKDVYSFLNDLFVNDFRPSLNTAVLPHGAAFPS